MYERFTKRLILSEDRKRLIPPTFEKAIIMTETEPIHNGQYKAFGWEKDHLQLLDQMAEKGIEPIRSLGHDAPLAALNPMRTNIADFIKESVAVVTNPAIDRDRETEHFSTRTIIGKRPSLFEAESVGSVIELITPLLIEGQNGYDCSKLVHQPSYDQVITYYQNQQLIHFISSTFTEKESISEALSRIQNDAIAAVDAGKTLLVLDDAASHQNGNLWLDPHLVTSAVDQILVQTGKRRDCSILLRSAALRSLHDIMIAYGLGANLISPYYMFLSIATNETKSSVNLYNALTKGLEKVISTIGIHELRGYGRLFSCIGLNEKVAKYLNIVNFFGSNELGHNLESLKTDAIERAVDFQNEKERVGKTFHVFPRIWKAVSDVAATGNYDAYREKISEQEEENPTTIRHLTAFKTADTPVPVEDVNISVNEHDLPFVISSMSFGSQNETAFRAYAEAANRLNMISINGEGGEIKDMLGKYRKLVVSKLLPVDSVSMQNY